jgi:hypothetical protein
MKSQMLKTLPNKWFTHQKMRNLVAVLLACVATAAVESALADLAGEYSCDWLGTSTNQEWSEGDCNFMCSAAPGCNTNAGQNPTGCMFSSTIVEVDCGPMQGNGPDCADEIIVGYNQVSTPDCG